MGWNKEGTFHFNMFLQCKFLELARNFSTFFLLTHFTHWMNQYFSLFKQKKPHWTELKLEKLETFFRNNPKCTDQKFQCNKSTGKRFTIKLWSHYIKYAVWHLMSFGWHTRDEKKITLTLTYAHTHSREIRKKRVWKQKQKKTRLLDS